MQIVRESITRQELQVLADQGFGNMVKAVVDVAKEIIAVDAELHADLEALLLNEGSAQRDLWGINLYPELTGEAFVEFDSMINVRPSQSNRSRNVEDPERRAQILRVVAKRVNS